MSDYSYIPEEGEMEKATPTVQATTEAVATVTEAADNNTEATVSDKELFEHCTYSSDENKSYAETSDEGRGYAIASLILGILSVLCSCCCCCNVLFIIPAFICAIIALTKNKHSGMAIAGLILSIFAIIITVVVSIYTLTADNVAYTEEGDYSGIYEEYQQQLEDIFSEYGIDVEA